MVAKEHPPRETNPDPASAAVVTIAVAFDGLTLGVLRWLARVADAAGLGDDEPIFQSYDDDEYRQPCGFEFYVNAADLPNLTRRGD